MATYKQPKAAPAAVNARKNGSELANVDMSVGNIDKSGGEHADKTRGIKIRGTGAATRGVTARGPMA